MYTVYIHILRGHLNLNMQRTDAQKPWQVCVATKNSTGEVVLQHENARVLKEPLASTRLVVWFAWLFPLKAIPLLLTNSDANLNP